MIATFKLTWKSGYSVIRSIKVASEVEASLIMPRKLPHVTWELISIK